MPVSIGAHFLLDLSVDKAKGISSVPAVGLSNHSPASILSFLTAFPSGGAVGQLGIFSK